jgi:hypothetical protein
MRPLHSPTGKASRHHQQTLEGLYPPERLDPARHGDESVQALKPRRRPQAVGLLALRSVSQRSAFNDWLNNHAASSDPYFFSVIDRATGEVQGIPA